MRTSFISAILLLAFSLTGMAQENTDWVKLNLKAAVKSIKATEYDMSETSGEDKTIRHEYVFNKNGYKTQELMREGFNTKINSTYKYSASNELTEETSKLVKSTSKRKYTYDKKNNSSVVNYYVANNVLITKTNQKHDANGNVTERLIHNIRDGKSSLVESYWYKYDDNNNLIEEIQRLDTTNIKIEYKYNDKGQLEGRTDYDAKGLPTYWYTYKYDDLGNVIEEVSAYRGYDKTIFQYVYVYDEKNNWIERREQVEGKTRILSRRVISYF